LDLLLVSLVLLLYLFCCYFVCLFFSRWRVFHAAVEDGTTLADERTPPDYVFDEDPEYPFLPPNDLSEKLEQMEDPHAWQQDTKTKKKKTCIFCSPERYRVDRILIDSSVFSFRFVLVFFYLFCCRLAFCFFVSRAGTSSLWSR
jgi:hypothetical protein